MLFFVGCMLTLVSDAQAVRGHAHNDYTHDRPLFSALESGLSSIEIDVHAHDGRLVVSHGAMRLRRKPGIAPLYLDPVDSLIADGSNLLPDHLVLMIDLKSPTSEALPLLLHAIRPLHDHLSVVVDDSVHRGDLSILVSGHGFSAADIDLEDTVRIFLDGRPTGSCDQRGLPAVLIPAHQRTLRAISSAGTGVERLPEGRPRHPRPPPPPARTLRASASLLGHAGR